MTRKTKYLKKELVLNKPPSFEDVSPFKELLYEKLDSAILDVKKHFVDSGHRYDVPGFFAKHVRSKLHDLLELESGNCVFSIDTSTGSFLISYKNFLIKFLKAYNGMFPPANRDSKSQLSFLNHNSNLIHKPTLPGFETLAGISAEAKIHLIACYDLGPKHDLSWFRIACPLSVSASGIKYYWDELVENPLSIGGIQPKEYPSTTRPDITFTLREEDDNLAEGDDDATEIG